MQSYIFYYQIQMVVQDIIYSNSLLSRFMMQNVIIASIILKIKPVSFNLQENNSHI
jgi:hypothetical protein